MVADPATAVQVAGVALQVSKSIFTACNTVYTFFQDVKRVGETAREFAGEIKALGATGELVNAQIKQLVGQQSKYAQDDEETNTLFDVLVQRLQDCDRTTQQLKAAVSSVEATAVVESNYFQKAIRQIKLNSKADAIEDVRNRIRTHTSGLLVAFQAINVHISLRIPDRVDAQIRLLLDELEGQRHDFKAELAKRPMLKNEDLNDTEETLLNTSYKVLSSGRTLYSGSAFGDSIKQESIFASARVSAWLRDTDAIDEMAISSSAADTRPSSVFSGANIERRKSCLSDDIASASRPTDVSQDTTPEKDAEAGSMESYSEDDLDVEAAQHAIKMAKAAFDAKDYAQASDILQEALTMIKTLPKKSQAIHDGCDIRYILGICSFYIYEPAEAEKALLAIVENPPPSRPQGDTRRHYVPDASHLLAQTYVKLGKLEEARTSCLSTLKVRAKLFKKRDDSYFESLALMARIVELQETSLKAKFYAGMLPGDQKEGLVEKFKGLKSIKQERMADTSSVAKHVVKMTGAVERERAEEAPTLTNSISDDLRTHSTMEDNAEPEDAASSLRTRRHSNAVVSAVEVNTRGSISLDSVVDEEFHIPTPPRTPATVNRTVSEGNINMTIGSSSPRYQRAAASDSQMSKCSFKNGQGLRSGTALAELMSERQYIEPPRADVTTRRRLLGLLEGDSSSLFEPADTTTDQCQLLLRALVHSDSPFEVARQQHTKLARQDLARKAFAWMVHETLYVWESQLHLASLFGDYEVVELLLGAGAKVNSTCVPGYTALHLAALAGHRNIAEALLDSNSRLDHSTNGLGRPLFLAVAGRRLDVIDLLLRRGAKLDGSYVGLGTVAHVACATGDLAFVHALYVDTYKHGTCSGGKKNGNDARAAGVWSSASSISTARVRELLRLARADPTESFLTQKSRHLFPELSNVTPLALAAYAGAADVVQFLVSQKFDPRAQCFIQSDTQQQRSSALDLACRSGHAEVVAILLKDVSPAKTQAKNCLDRSYDPSNELNTAVLNGNAACAASLLKHGMHIWLMLLTRTIRDGRDNIIRVFVEHGISAELAAYALRDRAPPEGTKGVSDAEKRCWHKLIANVDGVERFSWPKHGGTLLHTIKEKQAFAVSYLVKAGADVNAVDSKGDTSLMVAVKKEHVTVIHELLKCRASKDICNNSGRRVIDCAFDTKKREIIQLIVGPAEESLTARQTGIQTRVDQ